MDWQVNWKVWHWPWHSSSVENLELGDYGPYYRSHYAGIGPFQFHWYSSK